MNARASLIALAFLALLTTADASAATKATLTLTAGGRTFAAASLEGEERVSQLFRFVVDVPVANPGALPFDALLGQPVTASLALPGGSTRHFNGIASRISQGSTDKSIVFRIEVVPQLWLLTRTRNSRAFQDLSVPDILTRVMSERGIAFQLNLQGTYPPRDFVLQYRESDFAFVSRLMEEEGIFYFFEHGAGGHTLVIADSPQSHPVVPAAATVPFGRDAIHDWTKTQELRSGKHSLRDYHFTVPGDDFAVSAEIPATVPVGTVSHRLQTPLTRSLEVYDWPGEYAQRFDDASPAGAAVRAEGTRTVAIRSEQEAAQAIVIQAASVVPSLTAGHKFTLAGHFDANGQYVVTGVKHTARDPGTGNNRVDYDNSFTCIPASLPFRPARTTPRPVVAGMQTAVVTGPAGGPVFADQYGRVKVQFMWDREGRHDENSSTWIRVSMMHGGGSFVLPEVGDEVLVGFLEGDPDQPIIVATVPNTRR
jgi:type VI secretion system secreted protein VgrG